MQPNEHPLDGYLFARHYPEVSSTMDVARAEAGLVADRPGGAALIWADRQTAGRGRQGRSWKGAAGAFMGTFIFATSRPAHALSGYSLSVGVAIAQALKALGVSVQLKWPNDIVTVRGDEVLKAGGILIEVHEASGLRAILVGIGINLAAAPEDVPHAASTLSISGQAARLPELVAGLGRELLSHHRRFVEGGGFSEFRSDWELLSCFEPGRTALCVALGEGLPVTGVYLGIEDSGALRLGDGTAERLVHGGHILSIGLPRSG